MTRKRLQFLNNDPVGGGVGLNQYTDLRSYDENQEYHFAITWDESSGDVRIYENGLETAGMNTTMQIGQLNDVNNWLGRSNWTADSNLQGDFDEVRIYDRVLSAEEVQGSFIAGPDLVDTTGQGRGALLAIRAEVAFT
ncbi:MAG: LamG domain-containing protein, partial [Verrucomicrobiota bacterium]